MWVPLGLAGLFAYLVAHCFITVYEVSMQHGNAERNYRFEKYYVSTKRTDISISKSSCFVVQMVIDTIFLCFCEDMKLNNGVDKPYFMNHELMVRNHSATSTARNSGTRVPTYPNKPSLSLFSLCPFSPSSPGCVRKHHSRGSLSFSLMRAHV